MKTQNFFALTPGTLFMAQILDIQPGMVVLKLDDGTFTARTTILPGARIGESCLFKVKANNGNGQIVLEIPKQDANGRLRFDMRV